MSISILLEKYDVSTDEGLQKALCEIEKEEVEVDEALSGVLSRACNLEGRLRTASEAYSKLCQVKSDAQEAAEMVNKTADLARDVSAKVRQLDLARSRVAECQRRVHDLMDLQLCSAGVEAAIKAHDYETGAAHVARFLSMDPGSVAAAQARGAGDPREAMMRAATTLREHLVRKFEEAARKEDEVSVQRLFKLFPQLGKAEEGVDLFAKYLASQTETSVRRACIVSDAQSEAAVFADAYTRLLETAASAVERARTVASVAAAGHLPRAVAVIQPIICSAARRLYTDMRVARNLDSTDTKKTGQDPLAAEPVLAELALTHSTIRMYFGFLRKKTEADSASLPEEARKRSHEKIEKIIIDSDLLRTAQDLLGHYLTLERYFLEESVNKALKMASPQPGMTSSSLVDDVFFIARKVIRRSISTGSLDGACAVLNDVSSLLERNVANALRKWLRSPPHEVLPLPPPRANTSYDDAPLLQRLNRDVDAQKALFLAHMSEAEAGAEWSERLASEACGDAEPLLRTPSDREKLHSCAANMGGAAAAFRAARDLGLAGLVAALQYRLVSWADALVQAGESDDMEDDADAFPAALDVLADAALAQLSTRTMDALLVALIGDVAARAESSVLHNHYDRENGLLVERRARRLAAWAGTNACGARERCARLTQVGALLALERPAHAQEALSPAARLSPNDAKEVLARRTDFRIDEIKRLKL